MKILSVYDLKSRSYCPPLMSDTTESGIRSFQYQLMQPSSDYALFPEDFILYELGEFDRSTGIFSLLHAPVQIARATDFSKKPDLQLASNQ